MSLDLKANALASEVAEQRYPTASRIMVANLLRASEATVTASADEIDGEKENAYAEGFTFDFWRPGSSGVHYLKAAFSAGLISGDHLLVSAQTADPRDVAISDDGKHMYILGAATVHAYTLAIPFNPASARYDGSASDLDVSAEDTDPTGLAISKTGLKLYVVGATNDSVYSYSLSVAFDLGSAANDGASDLDISGDDLTPTGVAIASTGLKLYVLGTTNDKVYSYTLSTAFDLSTATTDASDDLDVSGEDLTGQGIAISEDGLQLWLLGGTGVKLHRYHLGTAYDLSTALFASDEFDLDVSNEDATPTGVSISPDGSRAFVVGGTNDKVQTYTLAVASNALAVAAHDLQNHGGTIKAQHGRALSLDVSAQDLTPVGLTISSDGLHVYVLGNTNTKVYAFTLSTAFDLSTALYDGSADDLDVSSEDTSPQDIAISTDGLVLFVCGTTGNKVYAYDLSVAHDLSTAVYNATDDLDVSGEDTSPQGIDISSDGLKLVLTGTANDKAYFYTLSVANDLSTATNDGTDDLSIAEDTDPHGVAMSSDGLKLYILGRTNSKIYSYTFGTAFDGSTLTYDGTSLTVSTQDTGPRSIALDGDGVNLYLVGQTGDRVYGYSMADPFLIATAEYLTWLDSSTVFVPRTSAPFLVLFTDRIALNHRALITVTTEPNLGVIQLGCALKMDGVLTRDFSPAYLNRQNNTLPRVAETGQFLGRSIIAEGAALQLAFAAASVEWTRAQWEAHVRLLDNFPFFFAARDVPKVDGIAEGEVFYGWPTAQPAAGYGSGVHLSLLVAARGIVS